MKDKEMADKLKPLAGLINGWVHESNGFENYVAVIIFEGKRKGDKVEIKNLKMEVAVVEKKNV